MSATYIIGRITTCGDTPAAARRGDRAAARRWREAALAFVPDTAQAIEKRSAALRARALLALGRIDEARPIVERLLALGYRHPSLVNPWNALTAASHDRG